MGLFLRSSSLANPGNAVVISPSALSYNQADGNFMYLLTNMSGSTINITGSTNIVGTLTTTGNITGNLVGTASWATNAVNAINATSASLASTASYVLNAISSSFATSASWTPIPTLQQITTAGNTTIDKIHISSSAGSVISLDYSTFGGPSDFFGNIIVRNTGTGAGQETTYRAIGLTNKRGGGEYQLTYPLDTGVVVLKVNGISANLSGSITIPTGSFATTGSNTFIGNQIITGSLIVSGSSTFTNIGITSLTGSLNVTGSTTQTGNNTLIGNTVLSGSIIVSGSSDFKNSQFIVTGSAYFKGYHEVSGSTNVTGSLSVTGDFNVVSGSSFRRWGNKLFNYAQFANTASISVTQNVSGAFALPLTYPFDSEGISIVSGSRITFANSGLYNIQFSTLASQGNATANLHIWFRKTGSNIDNSDTLVTLQNNVTVPLAWNFLFPFSASEYAEILYHSNSNVTSFTYNAAGSGFPASPSIILTVTQVA